MPATFDVWNSMLRARTHGLALHSFDPPPHVVLDLGCGTGFWAIEAAKAWPNTVVVGFDARDIQPKILHPHHLDIAHRVKWVHGNLLAGLPFHSNYFDFVRIVNIGLGVPENKWGYILEEAARVLKTGGVIEVIDEVPLFPCQARRPLLGASSSMTLVDFRPSPRPCTPQDRTSDLQDHSRLRAAWAAMLSSRSIAVDILSVLPLHLQRFFVDIKSMPPVQVLLPPNSRIDPTPHTLVRSCSASTCSSGWDTATLTPSTLSRTSSGDSIDPYTTEFAQMHLASTVHVVAGCKEAIWQEYKKLYDVKVAKVVSPNANAPSGHTASSGPGNVKSSIRESFDDEWAAWHNDMMDRIGMRTLMNRLSWEEPPGQRPDWHVWRAKVYQSDGNCDTLPKSPALCRSIHGFVACKP